MSPDGEGYKGVGDEGHASVLCFLPLPHTGILKPLHQAKMSRVIHEHAGKQTMPAGCIRSSLASKNQVIAEESGKTWIGYSILGLLLSWHGIPTPMCNHCRVPWWQMMLAGSASHSTMRFGSTAKVLLKCKLKYYRISEYTADPPEDVGGEGGGGGGSLGCFSCSSCYL